MADVPFWNIDGILAAYNKVPEMQRAVELKFEIVLRFLQDKELLTRNVFDASGRLTVRSLYTKDFTRLGMKFATTYETKWLQSKTSSDPVKGPKLLEKYLKELRAK